jgi:di/tricarboxylate transporter
MIATSGVTPARLIALLLILAVGAGISMLPAPDSAPRAMIGLGIVAATVLLWATAVVPAWASALLFFAAALASGIAPPLRMLSGFWSTAAMLILGGLILGTAAERSGLGRWIARGLVERFVTTYPRFLTGILLGSGVLSFLVPATMGRLALTIPIVGAIATAAGYAQGSAGYYGAMIVTVAGNFLTSYAVLTANLVNVIAIGTFEARHGPLIQYGEYLVCMLPVLGIVKGATFLALVTALFRAPPPALPQASDAAVLTPAGRRLAVVLGVTLALWSTDFIHHLPPGVVALAAGLICLLPYPGLVTWRESFDLNKATAVLSLAAVLGVATVLVQSRASDLIGRELAGLAAVEGKSALYGFAAIAVMASLTGAVATAVGAIATVRPVVDIIAAATGLSIKMGLIAELTGLQAIFFPFEAVPLMVGFAIARVPAATALRALVPSAVVGLVIILPLQMGWLVAIGALM